MTEEDGILFCCLDSVSSQSMISVTV